MKKSQDRHINKISESVDEITKIVMSVLSDYKMTKYKKIKDLDFFFKMCQESVITQIKNQSAQERGFFTS